MKRATRRLLFPLEPCKELLCVVVVQVCFEPFQNFGHYGTLIGSEVNYSEYCLCKLVHWWVELFDHHAKVLGAPSPVLFKT